MTGYTQINLQDILDSTFDEDRQSGEDKAREILSAFSCPLNAEIEDFLHNKAIEFSRQGIAKTHLVFASHQKSTVLVGFYALHANKFFTISDKGMSKNLRRRFSKFGIYDNNLKQFCISAPLIAQLGKNYTNGYNRLISGNDLLKLACDKINIFQKEFGGKITYLECEENSKLIQFYESNGFVNIGTRPKEDRESGLIKSDSLIQMIKYTKG